MDIDSIVTVIGIVGFAFSEIIAANPKWKSNSVLQIVSLVLKKLKPIKK